MPAPIATDDTAGTTAGSAVNISVLGNDVRRTLTVAGTTTPGNGTVVIEADDRITYTPDAGFIGADTFDYTIENGRGGSAIATVTITVNSITGQPWADGTFWADGTGWV